jgi:FixJ family two-component response regulator
MSDCEQQRAAMEPAASPVQSDDNPIVLVIDDDPDVREGLKALFESVNLQSRTYKSTPEFLRSKLPDQVSCLILDVRLPGLSGLDFQAELAKVNVNIPIIFITGFGDIPMSVKAMKAGAVEFLTKPIREQDLLDAVRAAIDRDRTRRKSEEKMQDLRTRFDALSAREQEVMSLVASGLMNKQVAAEIGIVEVTVKVHRHNIMKKLGAKSLADLVRMADALGLTRSSNKTEGTERAARQSGHGNATC